MDIKIEIKEEVALSDDIALQNERQFFTKDNNSNAMLLDNDCDVAVKIETSDTPFPHFCPKNKSECFVKHHVRQIKPETLTSSNYCMIDSKKETGSQKEKEFLPEDPKIKIKEYHSDNKKDYKIEIKEESWHLETQTSSFCDDFKDGDFTTVKSPRLCKEAAYGTPGIVSSWPSAETSWKETNFDHRQDGPAGEHQEIGAAKLSVEKPVQTEQTVKWGGSSFTRDVLIPKDETSHKCNISDKNFTRLSDMKQHNIHHHTSHQSKKTQKCKTCKKSFASLSGLKVHNLIHEGKKPYKCDTCGKTFTQVSNLKTHEFKHGVVKPLKCENCEQRFIYPSCLKRHSITHQNSKKPYSCDICEKSFTQVSNMKTHKFKHEGEKPYKCENCEKRFIYPSYLKRHSITHQNIKAYKCKICNKSFTNLKHLKKHSLLHDGKRAHKCRICKRRFTTLSYLKRHTLLHEGK